MKNLLLLCLFLALSSCDAEFLNEEIKPKPAEKAGLSLAPSPSLGNIFVAIVAGDACGTQKSNYLIYASAEEIHNEDREVQDAVIQNGEFIDAKVLVIPAGERFSKHVSIFNYATRSYGTVFSRAYNVLIDGEIVGGHSFPSIHFNVQNCYLPIGSCHQGIMAADDVNTVANEGPGDEDGDGICNDADVDDNGNDIPDEWEDYGGEED